MVRRGSISAAAITGLIQFDLSGLPGGLSASNVHKATMTFFVNSVVVGGAVDIAQITSGWTEGGATSFTRPTYLSPFLLGVPTTASRQYVTVDVTQLVRDWVSGVGGNYGVQISAAAAAPSTGIVVDSDAGKRGRTGRARRTSRAHGAVVPLNALGPGRTLHALQPWRTSGTNRLDHHIDKRRVTGRLVLL